MAYARMFRLLLCTFFIKGIVSLTSEEVRSFTESIPEGGKLWAVLVAGSNNWYNYRHQADVCHSYHVLHNHGIPDEQIVVMMYDDIAQNSDNPTPGVILNHINGPNVYEGVPHDYNKGDVRPSTFFNVLWGNESAVRNIGSGKVIKSGPKDHVFVYFADHGGYGIICFPSHVSSNGDDDNDITSSELISFLNAYYKANKYAKMVLYIEACESGSMFMNLSKHINVFATTAANKDESSYGCYPDPFRGVLLGDVYSVKWMEDSDKEVLTTETLERQYKIVKEETNTSHVKQFGDLTISKMSVSEFQGRKQSKPIVYPKVPLNAVPSREVPIETLRRKIQRTNSIQEKTELKNSLFKLIRNRKFADDVIVKILRILSLENEAIFKRLLDRPNQTDFNCYDQALKHFRKECFSLNKNEYILRHVYVFASACDIELKLPIEKIKDAMDKVCTHPPIYGII